MHAKLKGDLSHLSKTKNNVIKIGNSATNFSTFSLIVEKYLSDNERRREDLLKDKYKENIEKKSTRIGASSTIRELILDLRKQRSERFFLPEALFLLNTTENQTLIREAIKLQIPIIAVLGSSSNTFGIQYPIPGNTESVQSLNLYTQFLFYAIAEAKKTEIKSICS